MMLSVSNDIDKMEIYANGIELATIMGRNRKDGKRYIDYNLDDKVLVATIKNPVLMLDDAFIGRSDPILRSTLTALYGRPRTTVYDSVSNYWDNHKYASVWCPSIDTILYAKALRKFFEKEKPDIKNVVEIGCGAGLLGKYALMKSKHIEELMFIDLNPDAIECIKENTNDARVKFIIGDGLKTIQGKKYDLIICNPPYIPRPGSIDDNPYEGIYLLYHLVHYGQDYLTDNGILMINTSSLSHARVFKKIPEMDASLIETMDVPLKVNNIMNDKEWLSYLIKESGLEERKESPYPYWHTIRIFNFEKVKE